MRPGNCSGSYSEPPRARAIALRSSSCPREVDATTFSIRNLAMGNLCGRPSQTGAVTGTRTQAVAYMLPCAPDPSRTTEQICSEAARLPDCGILPDPVRLDALHAVRSALVRFPRIWTWCTAALGDDSCTMLWGGQRLRPVWDKLGTVLEFFRLAPWSNFHTPGC